MKTITKIILAVLILALLVCGGLFIREQINLRNSEREFSDIQGLIVDEPDDTPETALTPMEKYGAIFKKNEDFIGWLKIDGTKIDYPVVYTPDDTEEYIHKSFEGEYAFAGTLFTEGSCTISPDRVSDNVIIYGHNMKNDSMFGTLDDYADKSFYEEHKTFTFDTIYEYGTYEVVAAFRGDVLRTDESGFRFYTFIDAEDEAAYSAFISKIQSRSLYDTGITPTYGDKLLTLITCISGKDDMRFVVVARKIAE